MRYLNIETIKPCNSANLLFSFSGGIKDEAEKSMYELH